MLNIVCTSKPCDGLFYYSYEYCSHLNQKGIEAQVYVVTHRDFTSGDYTESISDKYIHCKNIVFNNEYIEDGVTSMILGRSMLTLAHMAWNDYSDMQKASLKKLFGDKLLSVYSENHPKDYPKALKRFKPTHVIDLCDTDVYPNGVGEHFEKIIHFPIYKEVEEDIQFDHLFLGTNDKYYAKVQEIIGDYPDHGILTYPQKYLDLENNNLRCPVHNLLGKFKTYVYTKDTFDPAPRLFQEARWLGKEIIYHRNDDVKDGGYWYWKRGIKVQDLEPIITALDTFEGKIKLETELVTVHKEQIGNLKEADGVDFFVDKFKLMHADNWFCSMPFRTPYVNEDGYYAPCNISDPTQNKYKSMKAWMESGELNSLRKEMLNVDKKKLSTIKHCEVCVNKEKRPNKQGVITSKRIEENNKYQDLYSEAWDNILNSATKIVRGEKYKVENRTLEITVRDKKQYKEIIKLAPYVKKLNINNPAEELLDKLVEIDEAKNIELKVNYGYHNKHYKHIDVHVKLDGVNFYQDFLHPEIKYADIKSSLDLIPTGPLSNTDIHIHSKVNFLSAIRLYEIPSFFQHYNLSWSESNDNSMMKANNLPQKLKDKLIKKYEKTRNFKDIADVLRKPPEEDFDSKELYEYMMTTYNKENLFDLTLFDTFPELIPDYGGLDPEEYCVELPQLAEVANSCRDFLNKLLDSRPELPPAKSRKDAEKIFLKKGLPVPATPAEQPALFDGDIKGQVWYDGIICYEIPRPHAVYNIINEDLFKEDPIRAYLSEKIQGVDFLAHKDTGCVLIFPYDTDDSYKLQYQSEHGKLLYEHKYKYDKDNNVIPILHNGMVHQHQVIYESKKTKYWIQIVINPKKGGWKELKEQINNGIFFNNKRERNGSTRTSR